MWGKTSWGTSAARWGSAAAVAGAVAVSVAPAGVRAEAAFGARIVAVATPSPASVTAARSDGKRQRRLCGRKHELHRGRSSTGRQGHKPRSADRSRPGVVDLDQSRRDQRGQARRRQQRHGADRAGGHQRSAAVGGIGVESPPIISPAYPRSGLSRASAIMAATGQAAVEQRADRIRHERRGRRLVSWAWSRA